MKNEVPRNRWICIRNFSAIRIRTIYIARYFLSPPSKAFLFALSVFSETPRTLFRRIDHRRIIPPLSAEEKRNRSWRRRRSVYFIHLLVFRRMRAIPRYELALCDYHVRMRSSRSSCRISCIPSIARGRLAIYRRIETTEMKTSNTIIGED